MDESNNLNPNGENNGLNSNNNSYQPNNDPYSSLNPDFTPENGNSYNQSVLNPILNQNISNDNNTDNMNNNPVNDTNDINNQNDSFNVSALDNQDDSLNVSALDNQNDSIDNTNNYQDNNFNDPNNMDYQNSNFSDPNLNYQDNSFNDPNNMDYQNSNFSDPNLNYQDSSFNNPNNMDYQNSNFSDPNLNYQDNNFNDYNNMNYQDNNFNDPNLNYQGNNFNGYNNMNYQDGNFNDPNLNYQNNNFNNANYSSDDYNTEFVKRWMGNLYDKAYSKKFNWCSALLGPAYFLYRKMYLTGSLLIVLSTLLSLLPMFLVESIGLGAYAISGVISLILILFYGFAFYPLYKNFINNNLEKLKENITDNSQLLNEASKRGNTSTVAIILYFVIYPILLGLIIGFSGIFKLANTISDNIENETEVQEPVEDLQSFNFVDDYAITYDAINWFLDDTNNSLNKGSYILSYTGQSIENVSEAFGLDATTPSGRSSLLQSLVSSYEQQAAASNLTVDVSQSNFISEGNAQYAYIDVTSTESIERYYLILIPEDDIIFQFVLTTDDTTIDFDTSIQVIHILTSIEPTIPSDETNNPSDENIIDNDIDENMIENDVSNTTDTNFVDDGNSTNTAGEENTIDNDVSSNVENNASENTSNTSADLSELLS